jgi:HrpA-like RNA helicase
MSSYPVDEALPRLCAALAGGGVAVLTAPPGAGKTTRVPPALLDALPANGRIVMTGTGMELLANKEIHAAYLEGGH